MPTDLYFFLPDTGFKDQYSEVHPYGPYETSDGNSITHYSDLRLSLNPNVNPNDPPKAIAVVGGLARCFLDTDNQVATLVLKPNPQAMNDLFDFTGGEVQFIYRNLDPDSVVEIFENYAKLPDRRSLPINWPIQTGDLADGPLAYFLNGMAPIAVDAGFEMGKPQSGSDSKREIGFEVIYLPSIAAFIQDTSILIDHGFRAARIFELIAPTSTTRRLDPVYFYYNILSAIANNSAKAIDFKDKTHSVFTENILTRRTLIEIRDEYDLPFVGKVAIDSLETNIEEKQNGIVVASAIEPGVSTTTSELNYSISTGDHIFTRLPSGNNPLRDYQAKLGCPAHLAVQALYLTPESSIDDPINPLTDEHYSWFAPNTGLGRYTSNNKVTPLIDGINAFSKIANLIFNGVKTNDDFILTVNWWLDDKFELNRRLSWEQDGQLVKSTFNELAKRATKIYGVKVRALLYEQPPDYTVDAWVKDYLGIERSQNAEEVRRINGLANSNGNGKAILDGECKSYGSHHQKFTVVRGNFPSQNTTSLMGPRAIAFCGGVDFNANRLDGRRHYAVAGYHDVHAMLEGPVVKDIYRTFVERWTHVAGKKLADRLKIDGLLDVLPEGFPTDGLSNSLPKELSLDLPPDLKSEETPAAGNTYVQIARTYPYFAEENERYKFAPDGSTGPLNALIRSIEKAKKFIYIEDQYLTPFAPSAYLPSLDDFKDQLGVLNALIRALERIDYILIVIPNHTELAWFKKIAGFIVSAFEFVESLVGLTEWQKDILNLFGFGSLALSLKAKKPSLTELFKIALELAQYLEGQARYRRRVFINALKKADPTGKKVNVFYLRNKTNIQVRKVFTQVNGYTDIGDSKYSSGGEEYRDEIYCHSKVWIVDDVIAKIGSANCNRRSYTHDSELDAIMLDGELQNGGRKFARSLRSNLWGEHLGLEGASVNELEDYKLALKMWPVEPNQVIGNVCRYSEDDSAFFFVPPDIDGVNDFQPGWDSWIDPDGRKP